MKPLKYIVVALAALAVVTTSAFAVPTDHVPDTASTVGLLGGAFAGLAGLRAWLNK